MRIVLDTNILARAAYSPNGPAAELLRFISDSDNTLVASEFILDELYRVLQYPRLKTRHGMTDDAISQFVAAIEASSSIVATEGAMVESVVPSDPDDDTIIATAIAGSADILCTLDRHLREPAVVTFCAERSIEIATDVELLRRWNTQDVDTEDGEE